MVNDTLISPEPNNKIFKEYVDHEYKKRGLKTDYIDTFEYAHMGNGNLHCSTHEIRKCKPRSGRGL
jgi:hypothetical protein